ncbi:phosphodiester glycosidase family protein [Streptomyces sp. K1PA1]|uniref:Phosphodiester glycosidase family protein n=1 Tax=Streptomyces tropicalis TaxID=3034234 RepID=A0ABT6A4D6_9ACTN|nr:phosphodiester glycosidase family protein [Streptomyces tropicalis]MDF3299513.1 phosphodiester glycosidase family protein [Streptomyces tropicalis]
MGTALATLLACGALAGAALAGAAPASGAQRAEEIAPGVEYRAFDLDGAGGVTRAHLLSVDLADRHVRVGLLHPGAVAARRTVSGMADAQGAVAGVNGDFFNISEAQHPGVEATGAAVGPEITGGHPLKAAVPRGQRFGPPLPPGTTAEDVIGVGADRTARLDRLRLVGSVDTPEGELRLGGLNQYALGEGSVGAYTSEWGGTSRARATCGTDTRRAAPCSGDTYEVTVRGGQVVATAGRPGSGPIAAGTTVLVGREAGARRLRRLFRGEPVTVRRRLVAASSGDPLVFAVGGFPVVRHGAPLPGLDGTVSTVRTAVGIARGGHRLLLLALDGASRYRRGLTVAELAAELRRLGATDGFNLDGGGSSTLVTRERGEGWVDVRNHPSRGAERAVANGVGVFSVS